MAFDSISGATEFFILSTSGHPVVHGRRFGQPLSEAEFISGGGSLMSKSRQIPNIFPVPAKQKHPVRPTYDRHVPPHPIEQFNHHCHLDGSVVTPSPFSVLEYLEQYATCFGTGRFCQMQTDGIELQMQECL